MIGWADKTLEERAAITAKRIATRRANKAKIAQKKAEDQDRVDFLKGKIRALEQELQKLEAMQATHHISSKLTGKRLLTEEEIVKSSGRWDAISGVYFLISGDAVVYVGQSVNVFARVQTHKDKQFDQFAYIPCGAEYLDALESLYIHTLRPQLNGQATYGGKAAPMTLQQLLKHISRG